MYTAFFGLHERPFSITPDPRYLFMSRRHADALAHLLYGISESGGFIQLTGEVGTGKTTLTRTLLERIPEQADVALILNPKLTTVEFLKTVCEELGVLLPAKADGVKAYVDCLNSHLLRAHAKGRRTVLIIDEAQQLSMDVLEQVRLLTNLETSHRKLLQIILIGQPELRDLLARNDMRQLAQRITDRYHLEPLSREETDQYIMHRLKVAGGSPDLFAPAARREIFRQSKGIPRLVNVISDRSLLAAYSQEQRQVSASLVRKAAQEVGGAPRRKFPWSLGFGLSLGTLIAVVAAILIFRPNDSNQAPLQEATEIREPSVQRDPVLSELDEPRSAPPGTLGERLNSDDLDGGTDTALSTLFNAWGADYDPDAGPACEQAQTHGLACFYEEGSIDGMARMDRPAVLTLVGDSGRRSQGVLMKLSEDRAELVFADETIVVDIEELAQHWSRDHLLLWSPSTPEGRQLLPGGRDLSVVWLRDNLTQLLDRQLSAPSDPTLFDSALEQAVREYQRQRNLEVDGLVGARTMIAMNNDLKPSTAPRLTRLR